MIPILAYVLVTGAPLLVVLGRFDGLLRMPGESAGSGEANVSYDGRFDQFIGACRERGGM